MANGCCNNAECADRDTQLRLARLREELLTNFNTLLLDRIRFLEQTITQLSVSSLLSPPSVPTATTLTATTTAHKNSISIPKPTDRLSTPSTLRRSSSTTAYFLQNPADLNVAENVGGARSCPSSVDLSSKQRSTNKILFIQKHFHDHKIEHHPRAIVIIYPYRWMYNGRR